MSTEIAAEVRAAWRFEANANPYSVARRRILALLDALDAAEQERDDLLTLSRAAIQAHRDLHVIYGSTSVCGGGIGGQALTQHCGVTCGYHDTRHAAQNERWYAVESAYFRRQDGDPDWAAALATNADRPEGDDSSAREGITAR